MKTGIQILRVESRESRVVRRGGTFGPRPAINAFTMVEILVVVSLLSLIVLSLMSVFNNTQAVFRASLTQTDVLEGGRAAMGLITGDLEKMSPSFGATNVNFYVETNQCQYKSQPGPLRQQLLASSSLRVNVLERFFILTRRNTTWTGVGYVVDTKSTNPINPLYHFSMTTNVSSDPYPLFNTFTNLATRRDFANSSMSHLMDGVMHLTVRAFDNNGTWMTNGYDNAINIAVDNVRFLPSTLGEVGCYMFSNTLPVSVELELGVLEDTTLHRAESLANNPAAQMTYMANHVGQVHLFRQRVLIRNADPSVYK